jgi:phage shock protein A
VLKLLKRVYRYATTALTGKFEAVADPKIQLEQAIADAQNQHRRLTDQAASVIANQKQTELRLNRAMEELEKTNGSARQAVIMADDATHGGNATKAQEYIHAAEAFANRLVAIESEVESLKTLHLQASQAASQAKAAVAQNATALQHKLTDRQKLLSQLDQAKMQEQVNEAMTSLSSTVERDVPSLDEVRAKIEARYAKALGHAELANEGADVKMLEIEQAQANAQARAKLDQIRSQLGLSGPATAPGALGEGEPDRAGAATHDEVEAVPAEGDPGS